MHVYNATVCIAIHRTKIPNTAENGSYWYPTAFNKFKFGVKIILEKFKLEKLLEKFKLPLVAAFAAVYLYSSFQTACI